MEQINQSESESQAPTLSEHDQAMIDKVDANDVNTTESMKTDEEVMLAGKYKSVEELEKAYEELQSRMGKEESATPPVEDTVVKETEGLTSKEDAEVIAADKGIDYSALQTEYDEKGNLSEETYKSLEASGIPKDMVDSYISGHEAMRQQSINTMQNVVGGEAEYGDMMTWASESLTPQEIASYNQSIEDPSLTEFAIKGLHARYSADKGPSFLKGTTQGSVSGGFVSKHEMMAEMSSPRYAKDPAFRAEVQRRVALSKY